MIMQPYEVYLIEGDALVSHPFSPDWYVGGSVLIPETIVYEIEESNVLEH
jgi:hypothetical protein